MDTGCRSWNGHGKPKIKSTRPSQKSLKRLQTDRIDLYQLHWPDRPVGLFGGSKLIRAEALKTYPYEPFEDILDHLNAHVKAGRIRYVGLSNETPYRRRCASWKRAMRRRDLPRMQSIQNVYNLVSRKFEEGLERNCPAVRTSACWPTRRLAQGYLSRKISRWRACRKDLAKALFQTVCNVMKARAPKKPSTHTWILRSNHEVDPAQMAIKFCDTRNFTTSTIIGATTMDQLKTVYRRF